MNRIHLAGGVMLVVGAMLGAACGGGGGKKTPTATGGASARGSQTSSPGAGSTTALIATSTPVPTVSDADAAATEVVANATATALSNEDITGGDPNATPHVVNTISAPQSNGGTTPVVDSTQIAPVSAPNRDIAYYIDLDASQPGIQSAREVSPGDVFQVAVVLTNIPPFNNNLGGIDSFNFTLNYDRTKIVAPSYSGGPPTNRNPKLNVPDLGGDAPGWLCLPGPEGDMDDPGGIGGDGNPDTGQAFISCYTSAPGPSSGTLVIATVAFVAVTSGFTELRLTETAAADSVAIEFADCAEGGNISIVPCPPSTVTVR